MMAESRVLPDNLAHRPTHQHKGDKNIHTVGFLKNEDLVGTNNLDNVSSVVVTDNVSFRTWFGRQSKLANTRPGQDCLSHRPSHKVT